MSCESFVLLRLVIIIQTLPPWLQYARYQLCSRSPEHQTRHRSAQRPQTRWTFSRGKMRLSVAFRHAHRGHASIRRSQAGVKVLNSEKRLITLPDNSAVSYPWVREASSTSGTSETVTSFKSHPRKNDGPLYESAVW